MISTDNLANHKVGSGVGGPTRSKHFLRRYHSLKQRIRSGEVALVHVPDPQMPADFLTKRIPRAKLEHSLRYACNSLFNSHGALTESLTDQPSSNTSDHRRSDEQSSSPESHWGECHSLPQDRSSVTS